MIIQSHHFVINTDELMFTFVGEDDGCLTLQLSSERRYEDKCKNYKEGTKKYTDLFNKLISAGFVHLPKTDLYVNPKYFMAYSGVSKTMAIGHIKFENIVESEDEIFKLFRNERERKPIKYQQTEESIISGLERTSWEN